MSRNIYRDFESWLRRVRDNSPPAKNIAAYNFGIFESESGYTVYLVGSREYDPDDDDWACNADYAPSEKYFELPESYTGRKRWQGVQREVVRLVKRFLESPESEGSFLRAATAITVGFDDGSLERVK